MVIKLIQIDSEDPVKITLSSGQHLFGRGKLLQCDDKRISRKHGELHVFENSIEIKALHQNPCFYTKKGTNDTEILRKDSSIGLSNGDRFGLLPDAFWYEVLHSTDNGSQENGKENTNTEEYIEEPLINSDETINENAKSPSIISETSAVLDTHNSAAQNRSNSNENETITEKVTVKRCHSIEQTNGVESKKVKTEPVEVKDETAEQDTVPTVVQTPPTEEKIRPTEVKNEPTEVKTEPTPDTENVNTGSVDDRQESNDSEGPSVNKAANSDGAAVNCNANRPPRERCMYGANCYRRNPAHFAQFSHPSDADWGAGEQAPCPFGAGCCRRDPRHFRDHSHPPGHGGPPPQGDELRKRRRIGHRNKRHRNPGSSSDSEDRESALSEDSESETSDEHYDSEAEAGQRQGRDSSRSPPPGMLVRLRKKHIRRLVNTYSGLESDDESDPFATDESDEWEPGPGKC